MCSVEKAALKKLAVFAGKHLCWSLFLIKLQACGPATLLNRDSSTGFPVIIAKFLRTPSLKNIC